MANGRYKQLYEQLVSESEARQSAINKTDTKSQLQNEMYNLKTRMEAAGVDVDSETDNRNLVEKTLGLPEDQNFLFDFFELLGRPQQALFGAWRENQKGGDLGDSLKSAWEHFKGDEETQFKDILMNNRLGMDFDDTKGKIDLVDVLGFAGDVALDPADWALIAASVPTGGTSLLGLVGNVKDVARVANVANDASKAIDAGKLVMKAGDAAQLASKADNVAKAGTKVVRKSLSDLAFEGVGKAIKGAAKLTDTGVTNTLKYLDETKGVLKKSDNLLNKAGDYIKLGYTNKAASSAADLGKYVKNADELDDLVSYIPKGRLETYVDLKESVSNIFKLSDNAKNALKVAGKTDLIEDSAKKHMSDIIKGYSDDVAESADKIGMSADEINKAMTHMVEYKGLDRTHTGAQMIEAGKAGTLAANKANIDAIQEIADDVNKAGRTLDGDPFKLGFRVEDGTIILDKNWDPEIMSKVDGGQVSLSEELLNKKHRIRATYTKKQREYLKGLENNKAFMEFYERNKDLSVRLNKVLDDSFGKKFTDMFKDNQGYVPHSFTGVAKTSGVGKYITDNDLILKGNMGVMGDRTRLGSVLEENRIYENMLKKNYDNLSDANKKFVDSHKEIFNSNFEAAMSKKYLDELPTLLANDRNLTETLVNQSFGNVEEMVRLSDDIKAASLSGDKDTMAKLAAEYNEKFSDANIKMLGANGEVPIGYTSLANGKAESLARKIENYAKQLGDGDVSNITKVIRANGDKIAVDNYVLNIVSAFDKSASPLERMTNKYLNFYKKWKVTSPTYLLNNLTGNMSNMWLSGIDITDQAKYFPEAYKVYFNGPELLMKRNAGEILNAADSKLADLYEKLASEGFVNSNVISELRDMPDSVKKYLSGNRHPSTLKEVIKDGLPYINGRLNEMMDSMSRTVVMLKGLDDPNYLAKLGVDNFGDAIRKVMFDPKELTLAEQKVLSKYIPFYTFAKKNLAYQVDNLGRNGGRYHKLIKSVQGLQDVATDGNRENMEEYIKNNLYIPIPGLAEDGSYTVIRTQLPFGNLLDMVSDPLGGVVNMLGPVKAPFEFAMNKNMFTGADIESYPGQKSSNIPFLTKKAEHALGSFTGFDVPAKAASRMFSGFEEAQNKGESFFDGLGYGLRNNYTMQQNINTDELGRMYDQLDELELLMKQYKGMGYEFATMNELKKANPNYITGKINAQLDKLNGVKGSLYGDIYDK